LKNSEQSLLKALRWSNDIHQQAAITMITAKRHGSDVWSLHDFDAVVYLARSLQKPVAQIVGVSHTNNGICKTVAHVLPQTIGVLLQRIVKFGIKRRPIVTRLKII
jgi:hypothetical protein